MTYWRLWRKTEICLPKILFWCSSCPSKRWPRQKCEYILGKLWTKVRQSQYEREQPKTQLLPIVKEKVIFKVRIFSISTTFNPLSLFVDIIFQYSPQNILLVQRQMSVKERDVEQFQQALKIYTDATSSQLNNLQYVLLSASVLFSPEDLSLWFHASISNCFSPRRCTTQNHSHCPHSLFFFLFLLSTAFQSKTCQTDHASSCMSSGRIVSPGWGTVCSLFFLFPIGLYKHLPSAQNC